MSQPDRAPVVAFGLSQVGRITAPGHFAKETKSVDLVAALLVLSSQIERLSPELRRVLYSFCREPHLPKRNGAEEMVRDQHKSSARRRR